MRLPAKVRISPKVWSITQTWTIHSLFITKLSTIILMATRFNSHLFKQTNNSQIPSLFKTVSTVASLCLSRVSIKRRVIPLLCLLMKGSHLIPGIPSKEIRMSFWRRTYYISLMYNSWERFKAKKIKTMGCNSQLCLIISRELIHRRKSSETILPPSSMKIPSSTKSLRRRLMDWGKTCSQSKCEKIIHHPPIIRATPLGIRKVRPLSATINCKGHFSWMKSAGKICLMLSPADSLSQLWGPLKLRSLALSQTHHRKVWNLLRKIWMKIRLAR